MLLRQISYLQDSQSIRAFHPKDLGLTWHNSIYWRMVLRVNEGGNLMDCFHGHNQDRVETRL